MELTFKLWVETVAPAEIFDQKFRSALWKKNRGWKKLLDQEPCLTLWHYHELLNNLDDSGDWRVKSRTQNMKNFLVQVMLGTVATQVFKDELAGSSSGQKDIKNTVLKALEPANTPEEALQVVSKMYDQNHPVRIAAYYFDIDSKVYSIL